MKLIRDFRLLENLTEMEAGLEAPKYHAQDIEDENKRSKLLSDNPNALVKFHNVVARIDNPKYKDLNEIQRKRLRKIKYRLARHHPPMDYIANNVVESKFFKSFINYIIYVNLFTVLFATSITTEFKRPIDKDDYSTYFPGDISRYVLPGSRDKFTKNKISRFDYFDAEGTIESINADDCTFKRAGNDQFESINNLTNQPDQFQSCLQENEGWQMFDVTAGVQQHCDSIFAVDSGGYYFDIWYDTIDSVLKPFEYIIMGVFIFEVFLYWIDNFKGYWRDYTKIFDFIITILCIIPLGFDAMMAKKLSPIVLKANEDFLECPYVKRN
jgi:hypothetical protein